MQRLRIYLTSMVGGLASAVPVLWISARIERQQAEHAMGQMRNAALGASSLQDGFGSVAAVSFGPGLFTWFVVTLVVAAIFYLLFRWQDR